jgi:hypothetical protein
MGSPFADEIGIKSCSMFPQSCQGTECMLRATETLDPFLSLTKGKKGRDRHINIYSYRDIDRERWMIDR